MTGVIRQAWRLARQGRLDDGLALLAGDAANAKAVYQRGIMLIEAARWEEAATLLEDWAARHPGDAAGALLLGRARVNLGLWDAAAQALGAALEREPDNLLALNYLALSHLGAGRDAEARGIWARVGLHLNREFLAAFSRVAERRFSEDPAAIPPVTYEFIAACQTSAARGWAVYRKRPLLGWWYEKRMVDKWLKSAEKLIYLGNYQGALELLGAVRGLAPERVEARLAQILALMGLERWADARGEVLMLLDGSPGAWHTFGLVALGYCYLKEGEAARALEVLRRCATPGPEDYGKHYFMGLCHLALGDEARAHEEFRTAATAFFADTKDQKIDAAFYRIMKEQYGKSKDEV